MSNMFNMFSMFNSLRLSLLAVTVTTLAPFTLQAAFINCPPPQATVVDGAVSTPMDFACAGDPAATSIRLRLSGTFQDNSNGGPELSIRFSTDNGIGLPNLTCTAIGATNSDDQTLGACVVTGDWVPVPGPGGIGPFTVTVTGGLGSDPLPFNGSASVAYETMADIPEPVTGLLLGAGLLLFALAKRSRSVVS